MKSQFSTAPRISPAPQISPAPPASRAHTEIMTQSSFCHSNVPFKHTAMSLLISFAKETAWFKGTTMTAGGSVIVGNSCLCLRQGSLRNTGPHSPAQPSWAMTGQWAMTAQGCLQACTAGAKARTKSSAGGAKACTRGAKAPEDRRGRWEHLFHRTDPQRRRFQPPTRAPAPSHTSP